jgi:hypothetical protein
MDDYSKILFLKNLINENKEVQFKIVMEHITKDNPKNTFGIDICGGYFFQKIYLHSCLKKRQGIAEYMEKMIFPKLGEIEKIAIRQCFLYGKHKLKY